MAYNNSFHTVTKKGCFSSLLLLCLTSTALAQNLTPRKEQAITYYGSSTLLWQWGATMAPHPLHYYFFPFTYTRAISQELAYTHFIMYRYENYYAHPPEPFKIWCKFHEIYILPGLRCSLQHDTNSGGYFSLHAGFGRGVGPNFSLWTMNFMPEVGYVTKPFYKGLFFSWSFALLFSGPLHQAPVRYTWEQLTAVGIISHMITPLLGLNVGWAF